MQELWRPKRQYAVTISSQEISTPPKPILVILVKPLGGKGHTPKIKCDVAKQGTYTPASSYSWILSAILVGIVCMFISKHSIATSKTAQYEDGRKNT